MQVQGEEKPDCPLCPPGLWLQELGGAGGLLAGTAGAFVCFGFVAPAFGPQDTNGLGEAGEARICGPSSLFLL